MAAWVTRSPIGAEPGLKSLAMARQAPASSRALAGVKSQRGSSDERFFDQKMMQSLQEQQIACVEYVDAQFGKLLDKCPDNTHFIITSDHGELFGEDGFFGHGPIMHEKVFEVPFLEGRLP